MPPLLGVFPFVVMFIVTSVATLRERTNGTLERLLTTPLGKGDFMLGYAARVRADGGGAGGSWPRASPSGSAASTSPGRSGCSWSSRSFDAVLGTALGLLASGFARTEFQAVQFMPAFVLPQFLLCGLLVPRELLPPALEAISNVLPLSYAVDAMKDVTATAEPLGDVLPEPRGHRPVDRRLARPGQPHPAPPHPLTVSPGESRERGPATAQASAVVATDAHLDVRVAPHPVSLTTWTPVTCSGEPCSSCPTPTS